VLMMMQLPFALLPIITFTSSERIMKEFRLSVVLRLFVGFLAVAAIAINLFFLLTFIIDNVPRHWAVFMAVGIQMVAYFSFVVYLAIYCVDAMGISCLSRARSVCCKVLFPVPTDMKLDWPWISKTENVSTIFDKKSKRTREERSTPIPVRLEMLAT